MRSVQRPWSIAAPLAVGLVSLLSLASGCGSILGINNVPNPEDGGSGGGKDGTSGGPDGSKPGKDGGGPGTDSGGGPGMDGGGSGDTGTTGKDTGTLPTPEAGSNVLEFHARTTRDGLFVDPAMTHAHAAALTMDTSFDGTIGGPLWGQPLYVENGVSGKGTYYVADDSNNVYGIDETSGMAVIHKTPLVGSAGQAGSGCGNVSPVGVTGTPIIDMSSRTMYLAPAVGMASGISTFQIHALSIDDLSEKSGYPIDVGSMTSTSGVSFNPPPQGQRSALSLVNGYLYVSWGGEDGDCGNYHGWVIAVPLASPGSATGYTTAAQGAGMWAVGGLASDGTDMFGVTGNATGGSGSDWTTFHSEAILRFHDGTAFDSSKTTDYFTPSNWQGLDGSDTDLVGAGPIVLDVPGATPSGLVIAMGKSGVMHLLDRGNLGGVGTGDGTNGEGLFSAQVGNGAIRGAAASYTTASGTYVVVRSDGGGTSCPTGNGNLIAVKITATSPPTIQPVWCADSGGSGSPIVTVTDSAGSNPIVWVVGAEGSNQLTGWDGETGANIFNGGGMSMDNVIHWTSLIDVKGRLVVGSNDKLYAFK